MASIVAFASAVAVAQSIQEYPAPKGTHPHDIAPAADSGVWYTAQHQAALGWQDLKLVKSATSRSAKAPPRTALS